MGIVIAVVLGALIVLVLAVVLVRRIPSRPAETQPSPGRAGMKSAPLQAPSIRGEGLGARVRTLFGSRVSDDTWVRLEQVLLKADVGPRAAADLVGRVKGGWRDGADPALLLRDEIVAVLGEDGELRLPSQRLAVVLVVGVNGSGKTTTIGKLAKRLADEGRKVSLAGSDTFRAAAGEQLEVWADRSGAHLVSQQRGADPGAVAFDAVKSASARGSDVLLVDTAGRLHTKRPLMDELSKIRRVIQKAGAEVSETLLVLDATTGQNGIAQARAFTEAVDVSGVVLTKFDGSARGGVVLAVREELGVSVRLVGVGEAIGDLRVFDSRAFADRLLEG